MSTLIPHRETREDKENERVNGGEEKRVFFNAHLELAVYLEHKLAQRRCPARRRAVESAAAYGTAERGRAKRDTPEGLVRGTRRRLVLEEV